MTKVFQVSHKGRPENMITFSYVLASPETYLDADSAKKDINKLYTGEVYYIVPCQTLKSSVHAGFR